MKKIVCLLLIVSIACAGCEVKESSTSIFGETSEQNGSPGVKHKLPGVTIKPRDSDGWSTRIDMYSELRQRIENLERLVSGAKITSAQVKDLLVSVADLGAALDLQRAELRADITKLKEEVSSEAKQDKALLITIADLEAEVELQRAEERADKLLLVRIADLEAELESQRAEESTEKALLARITELEAEIESQRAEIVSSTNAYCLYEVAMESQRVTIKSLEKLCCMYEAEIESQGKLRSREQSPPGKEQEAGQQPGQE